MIKDGGTEFGRIFNSSSDFAIKSIISDKDFLIQGNDGGSAVTALTLDMSAAGAATFNDTVTTSTGLTKTVGKETIWVPAQRNDTNCIKRLCCFSNSRNYIW